MKERKFPLYSIIAGTISILLLALLIVQRQLLQRGIEFYFSPKGFTAADFLMGLTLWTSLLFASAIAVFVLRCVKKKWLQIAIAVILTIVVLSLVLGGFVKSIFMPREYVELVSDDGEHCIIIAEDTYLFSIYGGDIYEKNSFCTMKKLTKYEAGIDFYNPFSDGKYEIVWGEDSFEITYDFDGKGTEYKTITVDYLK